MLILTTALLLALSRAEIVERFKAPVITQADGLVRVNADCPEDMRREYQQPIARFAAETVKTLCRGLAQKPERFPRAGIVIHVGDVRTNLTEVTSRAVTNGADVVSRIDVKAPGAADLYRLRLEIVRAFFRCVERREVSEEDAVAAYRKGDPVLRIADERRTLEDWLAGRKAMDDDAGLRLMSRVFEPGRASPRDILTFASRLYLYPPQYDLRFLGEFDKLSFVEALKLGRTDPLVRLMAYRKALELPVLGGGKSPELKAAADAYRAFLAALVRGESDEKDLKALLDTADEKLNVALEKALQQ